MAERTMFKCQMCKQVTPPRTKAQRIVLETRSRIYPLPPPKPKKKGEHEEPRANPVGYEIVREAIACPVCTAAYNLQKDKA